MRKTIACAILLAACLPSAGQEMAAEQDVKARYQKVAGGTYTQTEIDAKLEQLDAELINLREVNTLRTESAVREAEGTRTYIDRMLLITVVMLTVILYLLINGFRHQMNNQGLRLRRMLKEGETLMADVERLLNRPDVENYRASRKISEIKAQLKESSDRMLPQLSVRNIYEVASDPNLPALLFVQAKAIKAEQAGDWRGAVAHWEEVLMLDPKDPDNYLHLAHTYRNLSRSVTGEEHEGYLQKSLSYYQEYANRTKGLHDAFVKQAPPPPSDIIADQIRARQQQAVQPPGKPQVMAYRPVAYADDSVQFQTAVPAPAPASPPSRPPARWWQRNASMPQALKATAQPAAETQPTQQAPVQNIGFPQGEQPEAVPVVQAVPAQPQAGQTAAAPAAPPKFPRKPLLASVKNTAGSIGTSAERTLNRSMTALRNVAQSLAEGRSRKKEEIRVFALSEGEAGNVMAVDAAMSEASVEQGEIVAARESSAVRRPRLARRASLPGAGGPGPQAGSSGQKPLAQTKVSAPEAEAARQIGAKTAALGKVADGAASAKAKNIRTAAKEESFEKDVREPRKADASPAAGRNGGSKPGKHELELEPSPLPKQELPLDGAAKPSAVASNGRKVAGSDAPAANGRSNGQAAKAELPEKENPSGSEAPANANGAAEKVRAPRANGGEPHGNEATALERGKELFNSSMELNDNDPGKSLELLDEAIGIYQQVHASDPENAELYRAWGYALVAKAMAGDRRQRNGLFRKAADKLMEGNLRSDSRHENDFVIASVYALAGDEKRCRKWLEESQDSGLLNADALRTVPEFDKMRDKPWFSKYLEDSSR